MFWAALHILFLLLHVNGSWCCSERERDSLLHFKASVLDPSNQVFKSWHGFNCCDWNGIQCHPRTHHVIRLDLHSSSEDAYLYNVMGDVLSPLFNLEHLEHLDLSSNFFSGVRIPPGLDRLKRLRYLDLSRAGFSGDIPREVGNISTLNYLDLSGYIDNEYGYSILRMVDMRTWMGNMKDLGNGYPASYFDWLAPLVHPPAGMDRVWNGSLLEYGQMDSLLIACKTKNSAKYGRNKYYMYVWAWTAWHTQPVEITGWVAVAKDLKDLYLGLVSMSRVENSELDNVLSTMYSLTSLQMSRCELSGKFPPSLATLTNLTHLRLHGNYFNDIIPSALLSLPTLQLLDLSFNTDLRGNLSRILPQHSASLHTLDLSVTAVGGSIPESVANLSYLTFLDLALTAVGGSIPDSVANISSLTVLDLHDCLVESIPITMANLTSLKRLSVAGNLLRGHIPPFGDRSLPLGRHFPLATIDLSRNQLDGPIPAMLFAAFPNLQNVYLSDNQLTGKIPSSVGQQTSLEELDLSNNKLEGAIPLNISSLSKLKKLYLQSNRLSGELSESHLDNLGKLVDVDISDNLLTGKFSPTWIPKFSLESLGLSSCNMEGKFPTFLITQYAIEEVDLYNCSLAGNIPEWIWGLNSLDYLNLSHNYFAGVLPHSLMALSPLLTLDLHGNSLQGQLPAVLSISLSFLDVSDNQLSGSIPAEIGESCFWTCQTINLAYLSLSGNHLSGSVPPSICQIKIVDLSNNSLTGNIPVCSKNSSYIEMLNLENNLLEGKLPQQLGDMLSLHTLKLGRNRLNSFLPSSLANCKQLEILDLNSNKMRGIIPNWIGKLSNLKVLILRSNRFGGRIPSEVTTLPLLQILDLSSNKFSGIIPATISSLQAMRNATVTTEMFNANYSYAADNLYVARVTIINKAQEMEFVRSLALVKCIDLSNNNLAGGIPLKIGLLEGLIILNVSRNNITGEIPKSLGEMVNLESLDLSHNQLSGHIPLELQSLTFLAYLDLSQNNLSGKIPQGGQFDTFESSSFSNNSDLCGLQLNTTCCGLHQDQYCPSPKRNVDKIDEEEEDDIWWGVGLGLSFAVGFSIVIGVLCLTTTWSRKCFQTMDSIIFYLFERFKK